MKDTREELQNLSRSSEPGRCPDGGTCHHQCASECWRVANCGPLSGVFPNDQWPNPAPRPSRPSHDHEWDEGCTIRCPWRQYLIADVLKESDHA